MKALYGKLAILMIALLAAACVGDGTPGAGNPAITEEPGVAADPETVQADELPFEASTTLRLIESGGPFPYSQDGAIFHNYEGLLPERPDGYYREYTVDTPGSRDRGARRIVAGAGGDRYYTDDHYATFRLIAE